MNSQHCVPPPQLPQLTATPQLLNLWPHVLSPQVRLMLSGVQQVFPSQTLPPPQSMSITHCTHVPPLHALRPLPFAAH